MARRFCILWIKKVAQCGGSIHSQRAHFSQASFHLSSRLSCTTTIPSRLDPSRSSSAQDKILLTPGPLTTSYTVKAAAMCDLGSRDASFTRVIDRVCRGSGTYAVEAVLSTAVPRGSKVLIVANGAYGLRMATICKVHSIEYTLLEFGDDEVCKEAEVEKVLASDGGEHAMVAMVHSETTSGIINNVHKVGQVCKAQGGRLFFVDAMSSFGAVEDLNMMRSGISFLVSSSNKCIEGIPGFSYVLANTSHLMQAKGNARTLVLDLVEQREALDATKQFRFTPPTHSVLAFDQALNELEQEGGVSARTRRYKENQRVCQDGMKRLGFDLYLHPRNSGHIITSFKCPKDANFDFSKFYQQLSDEGFVIYPGKVSKAACFRVGHIGRIFPDDCRAFIKAAEKVCKRMRTAVYYSGASK